MYVCMFVCIYVCHHTVPSPIEDLLQKPLAGLGRPWTCQSPPPRQPGLSEATPSRGKPLNPWLRSARGLLEDGGCVPFRVGSGVVCEAGLGLRVDIRPYFSIVEGRLRVCIRCRFWPGPSWVWLDIGPSKGASDACNSGPHPVES